MTSVAEWIMQNKDKIEKAVEIMGQASAILAATVGQLHPILEAVFLVSSAIFSNPEGEDARYLTNQFSMVNQKLKGIQAENNQIAVELEHISMNKQNFDREAKILSQHEKYQDFVKAKPESKEKKMEKFLSHYENTDADLNLDALYNDLTGDNISGKPMLVSTEQWSRKEVEEHCARLKKLFVAGIIAVNGYASLKKGFMVDEMVKKWQERWKDVENRIKAVLDDYTVNLHKRAKKDMDDLLKDKPSSVDLDFTKSILKTLEEKYDWVSWSVRVFNDKERMFCFNWLVGKRYHGSEGGDNYFEVMTQNNIKVVISFSVQPKPINKVQIQQEIEGQKLKRNMMDVAQVLSRSLPNYQVHAVSYYKKVVESNNFQKDCFYYGKHQNVHLYIHAV
ncbi:protein rapunzel-like [Salvelinus sp. IW2-2015]|uniref:protein rapunzel-like n=1 Tax=Salvelinus sp. IW2-2015 TaxID=2691554 RepID=UPI000CDFB461|nr:uncharacterized protein LOC111965122 [Salvelinus alpinus]XP_023844895.1 uncharacterized protein LOC111965122 [Salvelinus alpinus]